MVCTMNAPLVSTSYLTYSSMVGSAGSNIVVDNIKINASIDATNITLNVGNINFNSISGLQSVTSDKVISNSMSTNQLSTNFLSTNQISTNQIYGAAITISSINTSTITASTISVSSMVASSMKGTIVSGPNGTAVTQIIIGTYTTATIAANTTTNFDQTITGYTSNSIVTMGLRNSGTFNATCTFVYVSPDTIRWIVSNPNATGSIATINYAIFNY
jgi:hypothetical protein